MKEQIELVGKVLFRELSFGSTTMYFFSTEEELRKGQIGYSVFPDGTSLVGDETGDWKATWQVIGYEDLCGDPIFVDTGIPGFPVFTAAHGMGSWNAIQISDSIEAFNESLSIVAEIAVGRENPRRLDENPIDPFDATATFERIKAVSPNSDIEFWENLLGIYR